MTDAKQRLAEGQVARGVVAGHDYELVVFKNPKVGHKPPRIVPFLTNCWFGEAEIQRRAGHALNPVVARYWEYL